MTLAGGESTTISFVPQAPRQGTEWSVENVVTVEDSTGRFTVAREVSGGGPPGGGETDPPALRPRPLLPSFPVEAGDVVDIGVRVTETAGGSGDVTVGVDGRQSTRAISPGETYEEVRSVQFTESRVVDLRVRNGESGDRWTESIQVPVSGDGSEGGGQPEPTEPIELPGPITLQNLFE